MVEALDCFTRAAEGTSAANRGVGPLNARVEVLIARARLLTKAKRLEEAAHAYALALQPGQCIARMERGLLLRRIGCYEEALDCFEVGIFHDEYRWFIPRRIRDARRMRLMSLSLIGSLDSEL